MKERLTSTINDRLAAEKDLRMKELAASASPAPEPVAPAPADVGGHVSP